MQNSPIIEQAKGANAGHVPIMPQIRKPVRAAVLAVAGMMASLAPAAALGQLDENAPLWGNVEKEPEGVKQDPVLAMQEVSPEIQEMVRNINDQFGLPTYTPTASRNEAMAQYVELKVAYAQIMNANNDASEVQRVARTGEYEDVLEALTDIRVGYLEQAEELDQELIASNPRQERELERDSERLGKRLERLLDEQLELKEDWNKAFGGSRLDGAVDKFWDKLWGNSTSREQLERIKAVVDTDWTYIVQNEDLSFLYDSDSLNFSTSEAKIFVPKINGRIVRTAENKTPTPQLNERSASLSNDISTATGFLAVKLLDLKDNTDPLVYNSTMETFIAGDATYNRVSTELLFHNGLVLDAREKEFNLSYRINEVNTQIDFTEQATDLMKSMQKQIRLYEKQRDNDDVIEGIEEVAKDSIGEIFKRIGDEAIDFIRKKDKKND